MMNPLTKLKPVHLVMLNEVSKKRRLSAIKAWLKNFWKVSTRD